MIILDGKLFQSSNKFNTSGRRNCRVFIPDYHCAMGHRRSDRHGFGTDGKVLEMSRESTKKVLEKYFNKQARKNDPLRKKRKYSRPEKQVEKEVMAWLKDHDFSCHVVEAKAVYSPSAGIYLNSQAEPGMSDVIGCTPDGRGCFIELKARDRRSALKDHQRRFLLSKISRGAFACVVDSVEYLEKCWSHYKRGGDMTEALPKKKSS